jgi:CBS domain-containing protein
MPHHQIRDVMTPNPITLPVTATAVDAAKKMREEDVGDIVVVEDSRIRGIVTEHLRCPPACLGWPPRRRIAVPQA